MTVEPERVTNEPAPPVRAGRSGIVDLALEDRPAQGITSNLWPEQFGKIANSHEGSRHRLACYTRKERERAVVCHSENIERSEEKRSVPAVVNLGNIDRSPEAESAFVLDVLADAL